MKNLDIEEEDLSQYELVSIVQIVRRLKQETHHHMWTIFETHLRRYYWYDKLFWSKGYFVCSIGKGSSYDTIVNYIDNQG